MANPTDILIDPTTGDLLCKDGDFICDDATYMHQNSLLKSNEGEYKKSETVGVGLENYLLDEDPTEMLRKIRIQFANDGMNINELSFNTQLKIRALYQ
ncbi:MAG: hypothetical protein WCL00_00115 [Bacteroidota bacterium]